MTNKYYGEIKLDLDINVKLTLFDTLLRNDQKVQALHC